MNARKIFLTMIAGAAGMFAASCGTENVQTNYVHDWDDWKHTTNVKLDYPIPGHMNNLREIYINAAGEKVTESTIEGRVTYNYPAGTIIAKEVFNGQNPKEGEEPKQVTAMVKAPDDPRAQGGWLWISKDVASGTETVFSDEFCITCHTNANDQHPYGDGNPDEEFRDFVFFPFDPAKAASGD